MVELKQTPFYAQEMHQCGPAALATVLNASGLSTTPEALAEQVYIPGREGSLQTELVAAARRQGRMAVKLGGTTESLLSTIADGRPVLLLQNLALKSLPAWHYAVLIGWDGPRNELILRSGRQARERLSLARFLQTWDLADRWAVVIVQPDEPPPDAVTLENWIAAASAFESLKQAQIAAAAYTRATQRWPDSTLPWLALANARYALGDRLAAEQALESAVAIEPAAAALNNLAQLRIERGCRDSALQALDRIQDLPAGLQAIVADTRAQALALKADPAPSCP